MTDDDGGKVFTVTMLDVLREPFERWLESRGLEIATVPESSPDAYIVVPREFMFNLLPPR
jgi:hypothetical protein